VRAREEILKLKVIRVRVTPPASANSSVTAVIRNNNVTREAKYRTITGTAIEIPFLVPDARRSKFGVRALSFHRSAIVTTQLSRPDPLEEYMQMWLQSALCDADDGDHQPCKAR
jgi:hypothetical protein